MQYEIDTEINGAYRQPQTEHMYITCIRTSTALRVVPQMEHNVHMTMEHKVLH